jgi:glutamate racemase
MNKSAPIGVFDSGIGGLSVLRDLCAALPHERFVYFADSAHAPYGEKGDVFVRQRSISITQQLCAQHSIKALVVACNTATAAAIADVRAAHPDLTIIGIEPALKPAATSSRSKHVTVFATRGTLASAKFAQLLAQQSANAQFDCIACDGLAEAIETHCEDLHADAIRSLVQRYVLESGISTGTRPNARSDVRSDARPVATHDAPSDVQLDAFNASIANNPPLNVVGTVSTVGAVDTVVLGCTHYPLVKAAFAACLPPNVSIIDNGAAVAKRLTQQLAERGLLNTAASQSCAAVLFESSAATLPDWADLLARSA